MFFSSFINLETMAYYTPTKNIATTCFLSNLASHCYQQPQVANLNKALANPVIELRTLQQ